MKFKYLVLAGLVSLSFQSHAADFSYTTFEASLGSVQLSDIDESGTNFGVGGTLELGNVIYVGAGLSVTKFDGVSQTSQALGLGVHASVTDKMDVYAEAYGLQVDLSVTNGGSIDDSGYGMTLGMRHMATDNLEFNLGVDHTDIFEETDTAPFIGAHYYVEENLSLGFVVAKPEDATTYNITLKVHF